MAVRPDGAARQPMNRRWIIRATAQDDQTARDNAKRAGIRFSDYVRRITVGGRVVVRPQTAPDETLATLTLALNRAGILVNQMMPIAHAKGEISSELRRATEALSDATEAVTAYLRLA